MYGKSKKPEKEFNINEFDSMLNSSLDGLDDNDDITDPDLLRQLQEMSSGNDVKPKKAPRKRPQQANDMDIDIDAYTSLAQGNDDIDVEFDERDLNDPNLLNELSLLSNDTSEDVVETAPPPAEKSNEVSELMNMGFSQNHAEKALAMFDNNLERAANYLFDTPMTDEHEAEAEHPIEQHPIEQHTFEAKQPEPTQSQPMEIEEEQEEEEEEEEEESTDPEYYKAKTQEYQQLALKAKKAGDKKKAVTLLRHSKVFQQKYQQLLEIQNTTNEPKEQQTTSPSTNSPIQEAEPISQPEDTPQQESSPQRENSPQPESTPEPEITTQPQTPPQPEATEPEPPVQNTQLQELLGSVIALQKQYKEAALHYKGLGNIPVAKDMLRASKELLQTGIKIKNGQLTQYKLPPPPDMSLGDGKIRQVIEASRLPTSIDQIESQLTYQMNICHNLSVQTRPKRTTNSRMLNDNTQDNYLKAEEAFSVDIMSLRAQNSIPKLHYEQVNYNYKNILDTIPDNMMEFKVIKALSLPMLDTNKLDPFVTWDFGGWPPENSAQAALNKGETPVLSGSDPEFDFTTLIPIARTNRSFQRYLQRKKVTVEVFHNKYNYGLFRRPTSLGKAVIPMEPLLTKSSISGVFDLLDGRKKTGGKIEIEINLREPLMGEDIARRSERWIVLDNVGSTVSQCLSLAGLTVGGPTISTPAQVSSPAVESPKPVEQQPQPATTPSRVNTPVKQTKPIEPEANDELEAAEEEFENVDNIASNMVLEHEMGLVDTAITSGQSNKSKDDLIDRKQALEIKMNMLVIQVQTGMLDMETYLQNVQKRMEADLKLALVFKKHKRLDLAKAALVRKKIMQNEIDEARAAMAEQEEE